MTTEERLITCVRTGDGVYTDGDLTEEMLEETIKAGVSVKEVYGDKAYFRKNILDLIKELKAKAFIPISGSAYRIDENGFSYNKDSDEWECSQGNISVKKRYFKRKETFYFLGYGYYNRLWILQLLF